MNPIFHHETISRSEWGTSRSIDAERTQDGSMQVIVGSWDERSDKTTKGYLLSADDAARFGRALCGIADPFDGLVERAIKMER